MFNEKQIETIEKYKPIYDRLRTTGALVSDRNQIEELILIYSDAVKPRTVSLWCSACVVEFVFDMYAVYNKYKPNGKEIQTGTKPEPPGDKPGLPLLKNKRKNVR